MARRRPWVVRMIPHGGDQPWFVEEVLGDEDWPCETRARRRFKSSSNSKSIAPLTQLILRQTVRELCGTGCPWPFRTGQGARAESS